MNEIDTFSNEFSPSSDKPLAAHILRLVFHDCAGPENIGSTESTVNNDKRLCDGCIDLDLIDHKGLQNLAIEPLEPIYNEYKSRMSRADFWASIGNIALEYTASFSTKPGKLPSLSYYFGRIDCPLSPNAVTTSGTGGTEFPLAHLGWDPAFDFFKEKLGLGLKETTAIFGAHTLGKMHKSNSGFDGQWTHTPHIFDNQFFIELWNRDNEWDQTSIGATTNEPLEFPQWGNMGRGIGEQELTMLNADYSLLVRIEEPKENPPLDENTGIVTCRVREFGLRGSFNRCRGEVSHYRVRDFAEDNQLFYDEFVKGWNKILTNNQPNLNEVIANEFVDNRQMSPSDPTTIKPAQVVLTNDPTANPTKNPTTSPIKDPTKDPIQVISDGGGTSINVDTESIRPTTKPTTIIPTQGTPSNSPSQQPSKIPSLSPTKSPSNVPTELPSTLPTIAPSQRPSGIPTSSPLNESITSNPSWCCIANKIPHWNGRCWSKTDKDSCDGVNAGRRCHWDNTQCRSEQSCLTRDIPCTSALQCCSRRCRHDNGRCS